MKIHLNDSVTEVEYAIVLQCADYCVLDYLISHDSTVESADNLFFNQLETLFQDSWQNIAANIEKKYKLQQLEESKKKVAL